MSGVPAELDRAKEWGSRLSKTSARTPWSPILLTIYIPALVEKIHTNRVGHGARICKPIKLTARRQASCPTGCAAPFASSKCHDYLSSASWFFVFVSVRGRVRTICKRPRSRRGRWPCSRRAAAADIPLHENKAKLRN